MGQYILLMIEAPAVGVYMGLVGLRRLAWLMHGTFWINEGANWGLWGSTKHLE